MENEIVSVETQDFALKLPADVVRHGQMVAQTLMTIINRKPKKVFIDGKHYLEYDDWQFIGEAYGWSVQTKVEETEIEGVKGAKATSVLFDKTGKMRGGADGFCLRDEEGRKSQPWFKLASMAQTRSGSKAFSNRFRWVAILAGASGRTAEENETTTQPQSQTETQALPTTQMISEIKEWLFTMYKGDQEQIDAKFKEITTWKDKTTKEEKWKKITDLPTIAQRQPDWLKRIHGKAGDLYSAYAGTAQE